MCEFCENPTKWNTDDYSLVPNRNLSDGIMQAEDNTYQIGMFDSNSDCWEVMEINFALSAVESWWKNETSKRMAHLRQVRKRDKSRAVGYKLNHEKWRIEYDLRFM